MTGVVSPAVDRFNRFIERSEACWLWSGALMTGGYGGFWLDGAMRLAHRLSYEWSVGPIPPGLEIDHLCRVRHCVNPAHLEAVTPAVNVRREPRNQVTHCPYGHPYDETNTFISDGCRGCRTCRAARKRAARLALKGVAR